MSADSLEEVHLEDMSTTVEKREQQALVLGKALTIGFGSLK